MSFDPVVLDFLKNFVLPTTGWVVVLFAVAAQGRNRKPHPLTLGIIGELVKTGTFTAENLVNLGMLKPEPETSFNAVDIIKAMRGGA